MSQDSLTARYRPQTFADVAGQDAVKRILSRAAATDRVAPAYLFSGTRGVGKTTLARIFAKALNCQSGPAAEPCNQCPVCRQITLGAAVDVVEIDGASNTGVDNVRRLKEDVGYAPLECRYKVIIIDEAHMLSKAAFNALLKTLEEPPGHVTFILATTEPEKFPQTILSRCQHFVFKRLPQARLAAHLDWVLAREGVAAEAPAVHLIARRGAGSVRDSMSLLSQVLALGSASLTLHDVREVLGLAGQEVFVRLVECVHGRDLLGLHALLTGILDQGVDLGFFLRELASCWRNLFVLQQLGPDVRSIIDLPAEEVDVWAAWAPRFSLSHLHAAWQMTLDSQRKILTSMEPALALELLLLNLASLPDLLAVGSAEARCAQSRPAAGGPGQNPGQGPDPAGRAGHNAAEHSAPRVPSRPHTPSRSGPGPQAGSPEPTVATPAQPASGPGAAAPQSQPGRPAFAAATSRPESQIRERQAPFAPAPGGSAGGPAAGPGAAAGSGQNWSGFVRFCASASDGGRPFLGLDKARGQVVGGELVLATPHAFLRERMQGSLSRLADLARQYFGTSLTLRMETVVEAPRKTRAELKDMALADPVVQEVQGRFQARIMEVRPVTNAHPKENDT